VYWLSLTCGCWAGVAWPITVSPLAAPSVSFSQQFGLDLGKIESPNAQKQQKIVGDAPTFGLKLVSAGSTLLTNNTLGNISEIQPPDIKATGQLGKVDQIKPQGLAPITTTTATANPATTNPNTSFSIGQTLEVPVSVLPAVLQDLSVYSLSTPNQALLPPGLDIGGIGSPNASILLPPRIEDPNAKDGTASGIGAIEAPSKGMVPVIPGLPGVGDAKGVGQIEKPKAVLDDYQVEIFETSQQFIDRYILEYANTKSENLGEFYRKYQDRVMALLTDKNLKYADIFRERLERFLIHTANVLHGSQGAESARLIISSLRVIYKDDLRNSIADVETLINALRFDPKFGADALKFRSEDLLKQGVASFVYLPKEGRQRMQEIYAAYKSLNGKSSFNNLNLMRFEERALGPAAGQLYAPMGGPSGVPGAGPARMGPTDLAEAQGMNPGGLGVNKPFSPGKIVWVDESKPPTLGSKSMSMDAYDYQSGAEGARSNHITQKIYSPALVYKNLKGKEVQVRFDGFEESTGYLIDRKVNIMWTTKFKEGVERQSRALTQNGRIAVWEVPNQTVANDSARLLKSLNIYNITIRVAPR
jgi:hypothetical protein